MRKQIKSKLLSTVDSLKSNTVTYFTTSFHQKDQLLIPFVEKRDTKLHLIPLTSEYYLHVSQNKVFIFSTGGFHAVSIAKNNQNHGN